MHSNVMYAVGGLIEQQTKAQLGRDWEKDQANTATRPALGARIIAFFGRIAGVPKISFEAGVVRPARA